MSMFHGRRYGDSVGFLTMSELAREPIEKEPNKTGPKGAGDDPTRAERKLMVILARMSKSGPVTATKLAIETGTSAGAAMKKITSLRMKGFVSPDWPLELTSKGKTLIKLPKEKG